MPSREQGPTDMSEVAALHEFAERMRGLDEASLSAHGLSRAIRALHTEIDIRIADRQGRHEFAANPPELQPGLHIGSGSNIIEGYTNLDIFPNEGVDVVCDAREGLPFEDDQFETIFTEHMLEHIDYPDSTKLVLSEMHRVLKPGGSIVIGVPDASIPVEAYAADDDEYFEELRERWYGNRERLPHYTHPIDFVRLVLSDEDDAAPYTPHHWGFDEAKLAHIMGEAGFMGVQPWEFDHSIANSKREWGSVYLEATKPT